MYIILLYVSILLLENNFYYFIYPYFLAIKYRYFMQRLCYIIEGPTHTFLIPDIRNPAHSKVRTNEVVRGRSGMVTRSSALSGSGNRKRGRVDR